MDAPTNQLRRSARLRKSSTQTPSEPARHHENPDDDGVTKDSPELPPRKRRKKKLPQNSGYDEAQQKTVEPEPATATSTRKGLKKRTLSKLPDMPLDILFEVFGHLHPLDLLHLARTSKALRNLLMHRSAKTIWMEARSNMDELPDCPSDLSEPQYAYFVFDPYCYFCDARVLSAYWKCRIRCCKKCFKDNFVDLKFVLFDTPRSAIIRKIEMLPAVTVGPSEKLMFLRSHVDELSQAIRAAAGDGQKLKQLEKDQMKLVRDMDQQGEMLEDWHDNQSTKRVLELESLRHERRMAITSKLADHGLAGEIPTMSHVELNQLMDQPWMKQPKKLTERMWSNIKDVVIDYMQTFRDTRLAKERCAKYIKPGRLLLKCTELFVKSRPRSEYIPGVADLTFIPQFRALLTLDLPDDDDEAYEMIHAVWVQIPGMCEDWRRSTSRKLLGLLPSSGKGKSSDDLSRLSLATTTFKCPDCPYVNIGYPRVLVHKCMKKSSLNLHPAGDDDDLLNALHLVAEEAPWSLDRNRLTFDSWGSDVIRRLVELCGMNPETTTAEAMNNINPRFTCMCCVNLTRRYYIMSWQTAVSHVTEYHGRAPGAKQWALLNKNDTTIIIKLEECRRDLQRSRIWACRHCKCQEVTLDRIKAHQILEHFNFTAGSDEDYCISLDAYVTEHSLPMLEITLGDEAFESLTSPVFTSRRNY